MREGISIEVSAGDRVRLEAVVADRNSPRKHGWRAGIILATAEGLGTNAIRRRAGVSKPCVWRWQERFAAEGVDRLLRDKTRPPGTPPLPAATVERVVELTRGEPPGEATPWTGRAMDKAVGISLSTVQGIWKAHGLVPHRSRTLKLSRDPELIAKLRDAAGLEVGPPRHAPVLSINEASQLQALERTHPGLPMKTGRPATMRRQQTPRPTTQWPPAAAGGGTHDYGRHGTTPLFAALNVLDGTVLGRCMARHRHQELLRFPNAVEAAVPAGRLIHAILDNYAAHQHPKVWAWLARHPCWSCHVTPTSGAWLDAVESFFAKLTRRRLRRGRFASLVDLQAAINRYLAAANTNPKPVVWTARPEGIIEKVQRGYQALQSVH